MWKFSETGWTRYGTRHEVITPQMGFRGLGRASLKAICHQCYPASLMILLCSSCSCLAVLLGVQGCWTTVPTWRAAAGASDGLLGLHQLLTLLLKISLRASLSLPLPHLFDLVRPEQKQDELLNKKSSCWKWWALLSLRCRRGSANNPTLLQISLQLSITANWSKTK